MYVNIERKTIGVRKRVNDYEVKQSSIAIGAHGSTLGQPEYPEYGVFTASGYSLDKFCSCEQLILYMKPLLFQKEIRLF